MAGKEGSKTSSFDRELIVKVGMYVFIHHPSMLSILFCQTIFQKIFCRSVFVTVDWLYYIGRL